MKFLQKIAFVLVLSVTAIGFGGCSLPWWNTSDWGSGGTNPYDPTQDVVVDVPLPDRVPAEEVTGYDKANYQDEAVATQGVRSYYMPDVDAETTDTILVADRAKFRENAAYQYEIIARYILHVLQGKYGAAVGTETINYSFYATYSMSGTFFADKKIRNADDIESITITLPSTSPEAGQPKLFETTANAINAPVVNVRLQYTEVPEGQGNTCPPAEAVTDADLAWQITGSDITTFASAVQLNIMQLALEYTTGDTYTLTSPSTLSDSQARLEIQRLAKLIDRLGVPQKAGFRDILIDYIENNIIGANLIERETQSIGYTDPSYTWFDYRIVGTQMVDGVEEDVYGYVPQTGYYQMLGVGTPHTFTNSEIYKFDYHDTVVEIVDAILGTYDSSGRIATAGFVAAYPQYTRMEATDSQPFEFYYNTDETLADGERQYITAMDYQNYSSMVLYPDASLNLDAIHEYEQKILNGEDVDPNYDPYDYDPARKRWMYDSVNICIESKEEITVDVYLRLHLRGDQQPDGSYTYTDYILHLTRMNTDPTLQYDYYPPQDDEFNEKYTDEDGNISPESYFDEQKTNSRFVALYDLMNVENYNTLVTQGVKNSFVVGAEHRTNPNYRQFFHEQQVLDENGENIPQDKLTYHDLFLGKLGSTVAVDSAAAQDATLTFTNFYGETVDLSDRFLCQDDCNFVEYIFDVKKDDTKPADYDYSFKFSILNCYFFGEDIQDEE